jgi:hypothetical protein
MAAKKKTVRKKSTSKKKKPTSKGLKSYIGSVFRAPKVKAAKAKQKAADSAYKKAVREAKASYKKKNK